MFKKIVFLSALVSINFAQLSFAQGGGPGNSSHTNCTYFIKYDDRDDAGFDGKLLEKIDIFGSQYTTDEIVQIAALKKAFASNGYTEAASEEVADQKVSVRTAMVCRSHGCGWPAAMSANYTINGQTTKVNIYNMLHWLKGISPDPLKSKNSAVKTRNLVTSAFKKAQRRAFSLYAKELPVCKVEDRGIQVMPPVN